MSIISCVTWVKKGVASTTPEKIQLTPKELQKIINQTRSDLQDDESDLDEDDEYNFNTYDDESGDVHCDISNIVTFGNDGKDPLVTKDDDDSEKEDDIIRSDDNLVLLGHVEGDASILEIWVYNEKEGSLYCHHDILLPSFPLCIEWLNFDGSDPKPGNLCAIGNMTPIIELWDLDLIDCLEPACKLGRKLNKKKNRSPVGHTDAVLDLAWNENYTHVIASGSVDKTVLLWDLENGKPVNKFSSFDDKIQSLEWHPTITHQLLTGCADKKVRLFDCRHEAITKSWDTLGEVEKVLWNHLDPNYCIVSTDTGHVQYIDIREDQAVWSIEAHTKEVTGLSLSSSCPGLLVTSANDGVVKVWDIINNAEPWFVWAQNTKLGALLSLAPNPDDPFVFAVGGDNKSNNFKVLNVSDIPEVRERFEDRKMIKTEIKEEIMDVTENMESMQILNAHASQTVSKKKKSNK